MALMRTKPLIAVVLAAATAVALGGCGVRGPLEPPPGAKVAGADVKSAESAAPGENSAAQAKPHEPFILDKLLR